MKRIICFIGMILIVGSLLGCGKNTKKTIEKKYNIVINTNDKGCIEAIEDYFSKMPEGFIDELLVRDENQNRKINISIESTNNAITCKWDEEKGFTWIIDNDSSFDWQLGYCTMKSILQNLNNREGAETYFSDWSKLNPEGFSYDDEEMFEKYKFNKDDIENSYFTSDINPGNKITEISRMFSLLVNSEIDIVTAIEELPHIRAKFKYICDEIDRAFESVNGKTYWSRYFY